MHINVKILLKLILNNKFQDKHVQVYKYLGTFCLAYLLLNQSFKPVKQLSFVIKKKTCTMFLSSFSINVPALYH